MRPQCRNACATAAASGEVRDVCRRSDEQVLYDCFEHQEAADSCCGKAVTSECLQVSKENVMGEFPVYAYRTDRESLGQDGSSQSVCKRYPVLRVFRMILTVKRLER